MNDRLSLATSSSPTKSSCKRQEEEVTVLIMSAFTAFEPIRRGKEVQLFAHSSLQPAQETVE